MIIIITSYDHHMISCEIYWFELLRLDEPCLGHDSQVVLGFHQSRELPADDSSLKSLRPELKAMVATSSDRVDLPGALEHVA